MHSSGWWIIRSALLLIAVSTISGALKRHSFVDIWIMIILISIPCITLGETHPPFGFVAFISIVVAIPVAGLIASKSRRCD